MFKCADYKQHVHHTELITQVNVDVRSSALLWLVGSRQVKLTYAR